MTSTAFDPRQQKKRALVSIRCKISPGAFSDEIVFEINQQNGMYRGAASRQYFWTNSGTQLQQHEPAGQMDGLVAARLLGRKNGTVLVSIPDGEVIEVSSDYLVESRPSGD